MNIMKIMTRENQIENQASEYANDSNNIIEWGDGWEDYNDFDQVFDAFKNGAKWADEHPKSEMVNKEEFIKKACKIYRKNLIKFNPVLEDFPTAVDEAVNVFRKQLEK